MNRRYSDEKITFKPRTFGVPIFSVISQKCAIFPKAVIVTSVVCTVIRSFQTSKWIRHTFFPKAFVSCVKLTVLKAHGLSIAIGEAVNDLASVHKVIDLNNVLRLVDFDNVISIRLIPVKVVKCVTYKVR